MKQGIGMVMAVVVAVVVALLVSCSSFGARYQMRGYIYQVNYEEDVTIIATDDGNAFGMKGTETWPKGTPVIVTLEDSNTETKIDDKVVGVERVI